jgi:hypothetical protein
MPNSLLSQAIKEAYAACPVDVVRLDTLEFRHPSFMDENAAIAPIRLVLDNRDWVGKLEADAPANPGEYVTFVKGFFDIQLAPIDKSANLEIIITVGNVSRHIGDNLELAAESPYPIEVTYRPFLSNDVDGSGRLNGPHMNPPIHVFVNSVTADIYRVVARCGFGDFANMPFPSEEYDLTRFPGFG